MLKRLKKLFNRKGRSLENLAQWLDFPVDSIALWQKGLAPGYRYRSFNIRKRNGGRRQIDAPSDNLRDLQRRVYHRLLKKLPVHDGATGFVPQRSIVDNARPHVGQTAVINIDLKDFFPSIKQEQVYAYWRHIGWGEEAAQALTHICCYRGRLPQGAPTSPAMSNAINMLLDTRLDKLTRRFGGNYTRYADDLTFSFPKFGPRQRNIIKYIKQILTEQGYEIQKKKKIRIQRSHQQQTVTGLVVNEKVNLPRTTRRKIRAMQHHRQMGKLSPRAEDTLAGYESLLNMIEKQR